MMKGKKSNKSRSSKPKSNPKGSASTNSWFTHDYFSKYWQFYNYSTLWYMNHLYYIRNASQAANWPVDITMTNNQQSTSYSSSSISTPPCHQNQQRPPSFHHKKQHNMSSRYQQMSSNTCTATEPTDSTDDIEMKVPDSLLDFMIVSRKFREEREALKNEQNSEGAGQCINIEDVAEHLRTPSILPPAECPGSQRASEMKQLYGKKASLIHSMETALQMTYDQMVDLKQPKMWPNMPLKISFN